MNRQKIGTSFTQSGYGRGNKKANVYLINGFAYAKSQMNWQTDFSPLTGELEGYVRVNSMKSGTDEIFYQVSDACINSTHLPYVKAN